MTKAAFRSMLETSVIVKEPSQNFTFDKVPKEAVWGEHASSPISARVNPKSARWGGSTSGRMGESSIFGRYPEADLVLYYDATDIALAANRCYLFQWTDTAGATRVGLSVGPAEEMGGMSGYMRIPLIEWFRVVE